MARFTRGFARPGCTRERDPRLPPGQYDTGKSWPVLTAEVTPRLDTATWTFKIEGLVDQPDHVDAGTRSTRCRRRATRATSIASRRGRSSTSISRGVSVDTLLEIAGVQPTATHVLAFSHTVYTTNLPLADVTNGQAWVVWDYEGRPLEAAHGGPARLLVPHLYFWKSAKFIAGLRVLDHDEPGLLGAERVPRPRRSLARTAVPGRLNAPHRRGRWRRSSTIRTETPRAKTFRLALPEPSAAPRRSALHRPAHRARRLHRVAFVLDRVGADDRRARVSSSPSSASKAARSRRSCTTRSRSATSSRCADRSAVGSCGRPTSPALLLGGGSGVVPADGDAAPGAPARDSRICFGSSCRCARPTTSTTPTRSSDRRRRSSTRAPRRPGSRVRRVAWLQPTSPQPVATGSRAYICGSSGFADAATDIVARVGAGDRRRSASSASARRVDDGGAGTATTR